ncbi:hypothetical protein [Aquabacterium sp. OR-4]|uniref:hypothetical protein n=1 Tax=Aquabacterium sp. OR-4 TaxID=2978127 RepID=UPI0021B4BE0F|nr:hypothetical protein [Aquabacterium sp. OR-4]MDT7833747.1 hypothetical protein [Aquabacterium sp. OR-4]
MKMRLSEFFRRNPYRPTSPRQRLVLVAVTLVTVLLLFSGLLAPHLRYLQHKLAMRSPPLPPCAPGQTERCLGGRQPVMLIAPAPRPAASR